MSSSPFDTLAQRIRKDFREIISREIRQYQRIQKDMGRDLSWEEARHEWIAGHRKGLGEFLMHESKMIRFDGFVTEIRNGIGDRYMLVVRLKPGLLLCFRGFRAVYPLDWSKHR